MNFLVIAILSLFLSSCSWVGEGEVGVVFDFGGKIQDELRFSGMELVILDSMIKVDISENIIPLENIPARDIDKVPLEDLDVSITFVTLPEGIVNFYKKTTSIDKFKDIYILGYNILLKEANNSVQKTIARYKSESIMNDRENIEKSIMEKLNQDLQERYPNTFRVSNVNLNSIKLNKNIEESLQAIQVIKNNELKIQVEKQQVQSKKELMMYEFEAKAEVTKKFGVNLIDYLKLEVQKDFNEAITKSRHELNIQVEK